MNFSQTYILILETWQFPTSQNQIQHSQCRTSANSDLRRDASFHILEEVEIQQFTIDKVILVNKDGNNLQNYAEKFETPTSKWELEMSPITNPTVVSIWSIEYKEVNMR